MRKPRRQRIGTGHRLIAFVLCFAVLIPLFSAMGIRVLATEPTAAPEGPSRDYSNTYVLKVDTGVESGSCVEYLGVRYRDKAMDEHTEFIFPHEGSLEESYAEAALISFPEERLSKVDAVTGYTLTEGYQNLDGLQENSANMYLFHPAYELEAVLRVDVFLSYTEDAPAGTNHGWTCQEMELMRVDTCYGLDMTGYYSNQFYIRFEGTRLVRMEQSNVSLSQMRTDEVISFCMDNSTGYNLVEVNEPQDQKFSNLENSQFLLDLSFADTYNGGIEALATRYGDERILKNPVEAITAEIYYQDIYGMSRMVYVPVITSALGYAYEQSYIARKPEIVGIAQQGEDVLVPVNLPGFQSVDKVVLYRGDEAVEKAHITASLTSVRKERQNTLKSEEIGITGFYIYEGNVPVHRDTEHLAMLRLSVDANSKPLAAYEARTLDGISVGKGGTTLDSRYQKEERTYTQQQNRYVVQITTDNYSNAATTADIQVQFTYRSVSGENKTTKGMFLSGLAADYYGYWPGRDANVGYTANMKAGAVLTFVLPLTDVHEFQSATFIMDTTSKDDWQMSQIAVYSSRSYSARIAQWEDVGFSDRLFTRDFTALDRERVAWYPNKLDQQAGSEKLYLSASEPRKTITFGSNSNGSISENQGPVDWSDLRYSMSFEEAKQDLGFAYEAETYEVKVRVAGNEQFADDDAGSDNLFYFKLVFESGSSAYVLANQQLAADGFRAGRTETFYISTNDDYGDLESISIIPDFNTDNDKQNVFDKLDVDYISVSKNAGNGLSRKWECHDVGWIDISYASTAGKDSSRTYLEGEIAKSCRVDSVGYERELLFSITTGSYDRPVSEWGPNMETKNPQYVGALAMTIDYLDADGIRRKESMDVVKAMYQYAGMKPEEYTKDASSKETSLAISNPAVMFRENHTDRFVVKLSNVYQILNVTLYPSSQTATDWNVKDLSVWLIQGESPLQIRDDEYFHYVPEADDLLCHSNNIGAYGISLLAPFHADEKVGSQQKQIIPMTEGFITVSRTDSTWVSTITREPNSFNDSVNIYVYMSKGQSASPIANYDMMGAVVYYSTMDQREHQLSTGPMLKDDADEKFGVFFLPGLKAPGLAYIQRMALRVQDYQNNYAPVDHVVIQHIRSGVVIDTYRMDLGQMDAQNTATWDRASDGEYYRPSSTTEQKVYLYFGEGTKPLSLIPEVDDLAIALRYKALDSANAATYDSKFVFLSDILMTAENGDSEGGQMRYPEIRPGMVVEIPFQEYYMQQLVGIVVANVGSVEAVVDSACVSVTERESGKIKWYSIMDSATLSLAPRLMKPTENADEKVVPVTIGFTADGPAELISSTDSGKGAPIRMVVTYVDSVTGKTREYTLEDIRSNLMSGSFQEVQDGKLTATISFFMRNMGSIRSIRLEPITSDPYGSAVWSLRTASYSAIIDGQTRSKEVEVYAEAIYGKPLTVFFNRILLDLHASYYMEATGVAKQEYADAEGNLEFTIPFATEISIVPKLYGSLDGYGFHVKAVQAAGDTEIPVTCFTVKDSEILFNPPKNTTGSFITYRVYVYSDEADVFFSTAVIHVESEEPEPTEPEPTETEPTEPEPTETEPEPTEEEPRVEYGEPIQGDAVQP